MATTRIAEMRSRPLLAPRVVAVIPAFNEARTVGDVVRGALPHVAEVVVVNDGSHDRTDEVAQAAGAIVVSHGTNRGLGEAFRTGIASGLRAGADIIVVMDADGQFDPSHIEQLIDPILSGRADVVTATRFGRVRMRGQMPAAKRFGNRFFTAVTNLVTGLHLTDTQCGFRAYSREAARRMSTFGRKTYTQEVLIDMTAKGFRIEEVPLEVQAARPVGKSRVVSSIAGYGLRALGIIGRAARDHKPGLFYGALGIALALAGTLGMVFSASPTLQLVGSGVVGAGISAVLIGQLAEMSVRNRRMIEDISYRLHDFPR